MGSWRLLALAGQGSYGLVFRAEHVARPEAGPFALKLARQPGDPRFALEVELLARIHHPNVPRLHDHGEWAGPGGALFPFLVLDWVDGLPLYAWARLHCPTSRQVLHLLAQVARALQATHEAGGLHRDIKGDNILVRPDGHALLIDFGSCTWRGAPVLTRQSHPPGTDHYWSPQAQLHLWRFRRHASTRYEATVEDDVYALGVTAYRLVTGRYPLIADDQDTDGDDSFSSFPALVPAERLVRLSPELARWMGQMLSEQAEARGTAVELAIGLELAARRARREADRPISPLEAPAESGQEAQAVPPRQLPKWRRWLVAAAASVMLAAGVWSLVRASQSEPSAIARESARAAQAAAQEGDTAGLGELGPAEQQSASKAMPANQGFGAAVPDEPLPGQRLPPCKRPQVKINGGCWILVGNESPPCVESTYEWKKQCYLPYFGPPRPSTSGQK
ncbi:MAG: serine/threonine protein kinase [Myxococcaceae bacterium]|nr:serine/threonine protein kinase [Myxococcaceae bacterium]